VPNPAAVPNHGRHLKAARNGRQSFIRHKPASFSRTSRLRIRLIAFSPFTRRQQRRECSQSWTYCHARRLTCCFPKGSVPCHFTALFHCSKLIGPIFSSFNPGSILLRSPTATTIVASGRKYSFATRSASAPVTLSICAGKSR
jgi:hypothetical protein